MTQRHAGELPAPTWLHSEGGSGAGGSWVPPLHVLLIQKGKQTEGPALHSCGHAAAMPLAEHMAIALLWQRSGEQEERGEH